MCKIEKHINMKKIFPTLLAVMFLGFTVFGQTAVPTPPPLIDDEVVKISTALIQLDVSVTDKKGNPVKDLKPEEVEIYENGKKQTITNFSFISAESQTTTGNTKPELLDAESRINFKFVGRFMAFVNFNHNVRRRIGFIIK